MSGKYRGKSLSHITFKIPWIMSVWKLLSTYPLIQCQHTWLEYKAYIYIISTHKCVISQCEEHPPVQYTHQTQHSFYLWIPLLLQNVQILITPVISCAVINGADFDRQLCMLWYLLDRVSNARHPFSLLSTVYTRARARTYTHTHRPTVLSHSRYGG